LGVGLYAGDATQHTLTVRVSTVWTISRPLGYVCMAACMVGPHTDCHHYCICMISWPL